MQFKLQGNDPNQLQTKNIVPGHCRKLLIPFAKVAYTEGPFGNIFSQEIATKYYTIEYHHFEITASTCLSHIFEKPSSVLYYLLKGNIRCVTSSEDLLLSEEHYYLFNTHWAGHEMTYEPGIYDSFHIHAHPKYLETYSRKYAHLNKLQELINNKKGSALKFSGQIVYAIKIIIQQILHGSDDELENTMLQDVLSNKLIIQFLRDIQHLINPNLHQRKINPSKIDAIKQYITDHLEEELKIVSIAKHFAVSESSLKRYLGRHLKISLHSFIQHQRMERAVKLLAQNIMVQDIARLTGYGALQAFSRAFSAYYGKSPSEYRKDFELNGSINELK